MQLKKNIRLNKLIFILVGILWNFYFFFLKVSFCCYASEENFSLETSSNSGGSSGWIPLLIAISFVLFMELLQFEKKGNVESPDSKDRTEDYELTLELLRMKQKVYTWKYPYVDSTPNFVLDFLTQHWFIIQQLLVLLGGVSIFSYCKRTWDFPREFGGSRNGGGGAPRAYQNTSRGGFDLSKEDNTPKESFNLVSFGAAALGEAFTKIKKEVITLHLDEGKDYANLKEIEILTALLESSPVISEENNNKIFEMIARLITLNNKRIELLNNLLVFYEKYYNIIGKLVLLLNRDEPSINALREAFLLKNYDIIKLVKTLCGLKTCGETYSLEEMEEIKMLFQNYAGGMQRGLLIWESLVNDSKKLKVYYEDDLFFSQMEDIKEQLIIGILLLQKEVETNTNTPLQLNIILSDIPVDWDLVHSYEKPVLLVDETHPETHRSWYRMESKK